MKKQDGTKIRAFVNNISFGGMQIKCSRLSAHILSSKSGLFVNEDGPNVELSLILPFKNRVKKIIADYKVKYIVIAKDTDPKKAFVIGLQVITYKGRSFQTIKEILEGRNLPDIQSNSTLTVNL